jgi:hypothetical protein
MTRITETNSKAKCQACDQIYDEDDLDTIEDYNQRVAPGEIVPAGQCPDPDCGALCHLIQSGKTTTAPEPSKQGEQIVELLWDSLKRDPDHKDRRQTGWGTKTKFGLIACLDRIYKGEL